jgi:DNA-binding IclR family transcriptional regulator
MATPRNMSVIKAFSMLRSFRHADEWLTSSELSRRANLPQASGYRLIQTLEELGAVTRGPRGRYRPGMLLVQLSGKVLIGELVHEAGHALLTDLSRRLDVTAHIGLLEAGMVAYVTKAATPTSFVTHTKPGAQLEAYCSGLGKVLLAALSPDELDSFIMDGELVALTPFTVTDPAMLRAQLAEVRRAGYAVDDREISLDMRCLAVPIRDSDGKTIAAVSATDAVAKMTPERMEMLRSELQAIADTIGAKILPSNPSSLAPRMAPRLVASDGAVLAAA